MTVKASVSGGNSCVLPGTKITITRPNNATAYAAGQVWGDAADARIAIVVPAAPADLAFGFALALQIVWGRAASEAITTLNGVLFRSQPATVLGDQAAMNLSDADIATVIFGNTSPSAVAITTANTGGQLNTTVGVNGRRSQSLGGVVTLPAQPLTPGETVYMYLRTGGAYNPVALEKIFITPYFTYTSVFQ